MGVATEFVLRLQPVPSRLPLIAATYPLSVLGEVGTPPPGTRGRLGWAGLGWAGLGWAGLGWAGLG